MPSKPEAVLTKKMIDYLNSLEKTVAWKIHGAIYQRSGISDILGIHKGRGFGIEVKMPGKQNNLTKLQQLNLKRIRAAKGKAYVFTSLDEVKEVFK